MSPYVSKRKKKKKTFWFRPHPLVVSLNTETITQIQIALFEEISFHQHRGNTQGKPVYAGGKMVQE